MFLAVGLFSPRLTHVLSYVRPDRTQFTLSGISQQTNKCIIKIQPGIFFRCLDFIYRSTEVPNAIRYTIAYDGLSPSYAYDGFCI